MTDRNKTSRRDFMKAAGLTTAALAASTLSGFSAAQQQSDTAKKAKKKQARKSSHEGPYNILMIVTDQERYLEYSELPKGYRLPGHERLAERGVTFENHQIASCVCTPSRAVLYTGLHIQNNGMFDNTNFPWGGSLSTDIDTLGDMMRKQGYYTAYKGKWHLTDEFETINKLHAPTRLLSEEMEEYGFSDYMGIGDIIGHTMGGYLHDNVISSMSRSWMRGKGEQLRQEGKPWFLTVNMVNPHDIMYFDTDLPGQKVQGKKHMFHISKSPAYDLYNQKWNVRLPISRSQSINEKGRPASHLDFRDSNAAMLGPIIDEDDRWNRLNNYYFNCLQDVDNNLIDILDELENLGIDDNTIVIFTGDHGELGGAHGLVGKGATAYREQNNVPLIIVHPAYAGNKHCKAVTSHVDIATTLIGFSGGDSTSIANLPGKDISLLLDSPENANFNALREGALYNFNMFGFIDRDFITSVGDFLADGGKPTELGKQGFKPNLKKRGAIRSICDGNFNFSRYFSPLQHNIPTTIEALFANNDVELYDLQNDPNELNNLAVNHEKHSDLLKMMNNKLNMLIAEEVGEDLGQMLPKMGDIDKWTLESTIEYFRGAN
ncbi:MAG: sulfatase-like hydrolase/transferase [Candidatus Brocadiaceae bacterium]|nr:sulfatase-like hydrolase/transferase [Candidatus Brocadiaceae bacterium]